jgi:hypothetical protein
MQSIAELAAARLANAPADLGARLATLDRGALHALFHALVRAPDRAAFEALLPR